MSISKIKKAVIREDLLSITENYQEAIILNQFIYWSERVADADKFIESENNIARKHGEDEREPLYGWIYKTAEELSEEIMLGLSPSQVRKYITKLVNYGYIQKRNNPKYKWDRTLQYKVNLVNIAKALKANGYSLSDYKIDIPDDNAESNARQRAINNVYSSNQTVASDEVIPEITTETINKDYKTENKDINAFRLSRKDRTYNNIKYYSNKDIYNKELYNKIYIRVIKSFIDRDINNLEMAESLARIMEYFYYKYENAFGEPYTVLSNKAFETVIQEYLYPSDFLRSNEMFDFESHKQMIDRYFEVDYGRNNKSCAKIELSLPHFMSSTIRENLAMQTQPMDNLSTSWTFA